MAAPTNTKQRVTPIESANKVEKMRPTGMAQLHTAPYRPKTRPKQSGSTLRCISAICGLLYNGDDTPIASVNARNRAKADAGSKPEASVVTPNRAIASTQETPWRLKPPVAPELPIALDGIPHEPAQRRSSRLIHLLSADARRLHARYSHGDARDHRAGNVERDHGGKTEHGVENRRDGVSQDIAAGLHELLDAGKTAQHLRRASMGVNALNAGVRSVVPRARTNTIAATARTG